MAPPSTLAAAQSAATFITSQLPPALQPPNLKLAIICGSGLNRLGASIDTTRPNLILPYEDIPGFHKSTVEGHSGKLVFGFIRSEASNTPVVMMVGRAHFYEGHPIHSTTFPIRVLHLLSIRTLLTTNAAGGLNPTYTIGDIVLLNDHLNFPGLTGTHPLIGPNLSLLGPRFPAMSDAYSLPLRRALHISWRQLQTSKLVNPARRIHEGVYAFVSGPSFETRAECRMLRTLGADVVGMSTVPEVVVARHGGMRVVGMSLVTNSAVLEEVPRGDVGLNECGEEVGKVDGEVVEGEKAMVAGKANHQEVLESGEEAAGDLERLVRRFVEVLGEREGKGSAGGGEVVEN